MEPDRIEKSRDKDYITFCSETHTIDGWSRKTGLSVELIQKRLECGWSIRKALTTPVDTLGRKTEEKLLGRKSHDAQIKQDELDFMERRELVHNGYVPQPQKKNLKVRCSSGMRFGD